MSNQQEFFTAKP